MQQQLIGLGAYHEPRYETVGVPFVAPVGVPFVAPVGALPLSIWDMSSPSTALYRQIYPAPAMQGVGQDAAPAAALGAAAVAVILVLAVAVNYQIGKAMAPDKASEGTWAWSNAIGGTVFPPFTLGAAIYKNYFRD